MPAHPDAAHAREHNSLARKKTPASLPLRMTGYASTWDLDLGGDLIMRGAYKNTLADWRRSGRVIPLLDSHRYDSINRVIGKLVDAEEDAKGLLCTFDLLEGTTDADRTAARLQRQYVTKMSIGYKPIRSLPATSQDEKNFPGVRRFLQEVELAEVSCVIFPMNDNADILKVARAKEMSDADVKALQAEISGFLRQAELRGEVLSYLKRNNRPASELQLRSEIGSILRRAGR